MGVVQSQLQGSRIDLLFWQIFDYGFHDFGGEHWFVKVGELQHKMAEYRDGGIQLGWLIDPQEKRVEIYRLGRPTEYLS